MAAAHIQAYKTDNSKVVSSVVVQAGDLIVVGYGSVNYYNSAITITDNNSGGSNEYDFAIYNEDGNSSWCGYIYYAIASANATLQITVTDSTSSQPAVYVHVARGCLATLSLVLDSASSGIDTSRDTVHTSGNVTTSVTGCYLFTFWNNHDNGGTITDTAGFTIRQSNYTAQAAASMDKISGAPGSYNDTINTDTATYENVVIAAFKPAASSYDSTKMMFAA